MAEEAFKKAGDRAVFEDTNLNDQDRKRVDDLSKRRWIEIVRRRREQWARRDADIAKARREIITQHNQLLLKPPWDKGRSIPAWKVDALARRLVWEWNVRELGEVNARFEEEKRDIFSRAYAQDREAIETIREQKKRDRSVTRYRRRSRDTGDRDR